MTSTDWAALLTEPKAILGAYKGCAPSLASFAPHAWHAHFDQVSIAGQFMQLPDQVPPGWVDAGAARADVVLRFSGVRLLRVEGTLTASTEDDSLHGKPCGVLGKCALVALPEAFIHDVDRALVLPWKQFSVAQGSFSLLLEAGNVAILCGNSARRSYGTFWA